MLYTLPKIMVALTLLAIAGIGLSSPMSLRSSYSIKESFNVPPKWSRVGRAPSNHTLNLQIGLKQSQFDVLENNLYAGKLVDMVVASLRTILFERTKSRSQQPSFVLTTGSIYPYSAPQLGIDTILLPNHDGDRYTHTLDDVQLDVPRQVLPNLVLLLNFL